MKDGTTELGKDICKQGEDWSRKQVLVKLTGKGKKCLLHRPKLPKLYCTGVLVQENSPGKKGGGWMSREEHTIDEGGRGLQYPCIKNTQGTQE